MKQNADPLMQTPSALLEEIKFLSSSLEKREIGANIVNQ